MGCPVVHFEIGCRDRARIETFYRRLFDWNINPMGVVDSSPSGIGGHINALGHEPHNYTTFYIEVNDVAAYLEKAGGLGGRTLVGPIEIPNGTFAWMADPEGNVVGLWKSKR